MEKISISKILDNTFSFIFKNIGWILAVGIIPAFIEIFGSKYAFVGTYPLFTAIGVLTCYRWYKGIPFNWNEMLDITLKNYIKIVGSMIIYFLAVACGFICFIIPGIIVTIALICFIPILLIEKCSISESWNRSFRLTKGNRWRILGMQCVLAFAVVFVQMIVAIITPKFAGITNMVFWPIYPVSATFLYFELREKKEGLDIEQEIEVEVIS